MPVSPWKSFPILYHEFATCGEFCFGYDGAMWYALFGVLGAALTLVLHELSHCLVVWWSGGKVVTFKPWPHMSDGHFYFGRMTYIAKVPLGPLMKIIPFLKALTLFGWWVGLGVLWHPLWVLAFWEITDWINWLQGYIRGSDNDGGQYRFGDPR